MARSEIERAIDTALARKGIAGTVVVRESIAELHGEQHPVVAIDLGEWVDQWNLLPPEMAERRAEAAATRLVTALREVRGQPPITAPRTRVVSLGGLGVLIVGAVIAWGLHASGFFGRAPQAAPSASAGPLVPAEPDGARARRACEAARQRLYAGAEMGIDAEGWIVELWLARGDVGIVAPLTEAAGALPESAVVEAAGEAAAVVRFSGDAAHRFFARDGRDRLVAIAERLAAETSASQGALYARCAHLATHDVGAWYFGRDDAALVAALWQTAGAHAENRAVDLAALAPLDEKAAGAARQLPSLLRGVGGRREEREAGVALRFPLGGPTRAAELSRQLAAGAR